MDYSQALERLRNHANMPGTNLPERESFLFVLWQANRDGVVPELTRLYGDLLACLVSVSRHLNGEQPSAHVEGKSDVVPRQLAGSVADVLLNGWCYLCQWNRQDRFEPAFRADLEALLLKVGIAWEAVLAGDVDDIREHTETEFLAKDLGP